MRRDGHPSGAEIEVAEVDGAADVNRFVRLPWRLYRDDPAWVPPLRIDRKDFINRRKHPFYRHGAASCLLARRDGEAVGRILVSDDPRFNETHGTNLGCFGLFESVPDRSVAHALLDRAAQWLRDRGRTAIMGPIDYSTNYPCGLLVEGFEKPPTILLNHNPRSYAELLESWGLKKAKDLYTYWFTEDRGVPERWRRLADALARRGRVRIRGIDVRDFEAEVARMRELYNGAWEKNWGFVRMTEAEFDHLAHDVKRIVVPELVLIAEVEGKPVGFCMSLPDINHTLRRIDGRLFPFGGLRLLYDLKLRRVHTIRTLILGVLAGYRRRGITELFILRTFDEATRLGFDTCEMGWNLEDNDLINRGIENLGGRRHKVYRIYERELD